MFTQLSNPAKGVLFFAITLALTLCVSLLAPVLGDATMFLHMFSPTLATLLMLLVVTRDGYSRAAWRSLGLHRAGLGSWPLALVGPVIVMSIVYGLVWGSGMARAVMPAGYTLGGLPLEFVAQLVINSLFAVGEEIGFRGYLLPRFLPLGTTRALLLSGMMHGIWHFPLMLLTPLYPVLGSWLIVGPVILMTLTAAGVFYGYLRLTSGSVWPATLAHGTINACFNIFALFTVTSSPLALEYLAGETGVLTLVATALAAVWLLSRLRRPRNAAVLQPQPGM